MAAMQPASGDTTTFGRLGSLLWFPGIAERIASFVGPNDVACGLRLANKATASLFDSENYKKIRLSQSVPHDEFVRHWSAPAALVAMPRSRRNQLACLTVASGNIANLEAVLQLTGVLVPLRAWCFAARDGRINMCEWLLKHRTPFDKEYEALQAAAMFGHQAVCRWLLSHGYPWVPDAVCFAAKGGHFDLAEWLLQQRDRSCLMFGFEPLGKSWEAAVTCAVAEGCDLATLQRVFAVLVEEPAGVDGAANEQSDALGAQLRRIRALFNRPSQPDSGGNAGGDPSLGADDEEAEGQEEQEDSEDEEEGEDSEEDEGEDSEDEDEGEESEEDEHLQRQRLFHQQRRQLRAWRQPGQAQALFPHWGGWPTDEHSTYMERSLVLMSAAGSPTPDWKAKVEWLESRGCPGCEMVCLRAAERPDAPERFAWMRSRGYPVGRMAVETAAWNGHRDAVQQMYDEGVWINASKAAIDAATAGDLQSFQSLVDAGIRFDADEALCAAAGNGHLPVVAWLVAASGRRVELSGEVFALAARSGSVEVMAWLAEHGCPMPDDGEPFMVPAIEADTAALDCLLRLRCPWGPPGAVFTACIGSRVELPVLAWLLEAGCPVDWEEAAAAARDADSADVAEWLQGARTRWEQRQRRAQRVTRRRQPAVAAAVAAAAVAVLAAAVVVVGRSARRSA